MLHLLESFVRIFEFKLSAKPEIYGIYHIVCLGIVILAAVLFAVFFKNVSNKTIRAILLGAWITIVLLEIIKQLEGAYSPYYWGTDYDWATYRWEYLWHSFPYQFCSTPYYCLPFIIFLPDGFWRRSFIAFFATFSLFAGLIVMFYPGDVFVTNLFLDVQTMIHHGSMVIISVLLIAHERHKFKIKYFLGALAIFAAFVAVAVALNELLYYFVLAGLENQAVNLFLISSHYQTTLPVLSLLSGKIPYPVYLATYFVCFSLASAIIFFAEKGILALAMLPQKIKAKKDQLINN